YPDAPDIEETGRTFQDNALLKANGISEHFQTAVIADDSGLIIDALDGRPGVLSARYAGVEKDDDANIDKVIGELEGIAFDDRTARFHCTLVLKIPGRDPVIVDGTCEGVILNERRGTNGFGYDPIFYIPELNKTMAELNADEK